MAWRLAAADLTGVNRNTAILYFHKLRELIAQKLAAQTPFLAGEVEADEIYFGGRRKGKRGRGAAGKVPVFGLLKRGSLIHTVMIQDTKSLTWMAIIRERIEPDGIVFSDSFRSCDILDVSEFHHYRINHKEKFASGGNHINGIENFWNQAKRHLAACNGIPKSHFFLFLKECEWRFNNRPVCISEERDSDFTKSRTFVSLIPGQFDVLSFRLSGENHRLKIY